MKRSSLLVTIVTLALAGNAAVVGAEPVPSVLIRPPGAPPPAAAGASNVLYLNRCSGGCPITGSTSDDATANLSSLPCAAGAQCNGGSCFCSMPGGTFMVGEFKNSMGQIGSAADAEWAMLVQCVKEVYSPYAITVTDQKPTAGQSYTEGIVAGVPEDIGWSSSQVAGIASGPNGDCSPQSNVISFSFANVYGGSAAARTIELCGTAGQETAHAFGLDHEYSFVDGTSACRSPMSYRQDCGGQRFFRGQAANCGEFAQRTCRCGGLQASHKKLLSIFGPGTPITAPPHLAVTLPANGATVMNGAAVQLTAGAQRGVARVELWLNNHEWAQAAGAAWGAQGQPDPSNYALVFPATVPDGVIDIQVKAFDDIEAEADSPIITVTKGAPCASATSCLKGQKCDAGKCYWDPPTGVLGDACTYNEFCLSGICSGTSDTQICTQNCVVGSTDACPMGYECIATTDTQGICFPQGANSGCCSTSSAGTGAMWAHGGLAGFVIALVLRRRRRR